MAYHINKRQLTNLTKKAISSANNDGREICGLIIYNNFSLDLLEVKNKVEQGGSFAFYTTEIRSIQKAVTLLGYTIVGTFHSHPYGPAEPGDSDIEGTLDDALMLVISCLDKNSKLWKIKNGSAKRLMFKLF